MKIVLIDDHEFALNNLENAISLYFERIGIENYEISKFSNISNLTLERVVRIKPNCVFCDINFPGKDGEIAGIKFIEKLVQRDSYFNNIPIVFLTFHENDAIQDRAMKSALKVRYLEKDYLFNARLETQARRIGAILIELLFLRASITVNKKKIFLSQIVFVKYKDNIVQIRLSDGRVLKFVCALKDIYEMSTIDNKPTCLVYSDRDELVNINYITDIQDFGRTHKLILATVVEPIVTSQRQGDFILNMWLGKTISS